MFLVGHTAMPPLALETAAIIACQNRAILSHWTAACLFELLRPDPAAPIHLTVGRRRRPRDGIVIHESAALGVDAIGFVRGLPATNPLRTLTDLASVASARQLERALSEARVRSLIPRDAGPELLAGSASRPGVSRLRGLLLDQDEPSITESEAEERLLALVRRSGLPEPRVGYRLDRFKVDFCWPEQRLVVEIDGYAFHSTRAAMERDRARDARLDELGHRVRRFSWRQLVREPERVIAEIARCLFARV